MNDTGIERPKVSKVKVTVTNVKGGSEKETAIELTFDIGIIQNQFLYSPTIVLGTSDKYEIDQNISPIVRNNIVTYEGIPGDPLNRATNPLYVEVLFSVSPGVEYSYAN